MQLVEIVRKSRSFIILAPVDAEVPAPFQKIDMCHEKHRKVFSEMQTMRGKVALHEGAILASALDADGRHHMPGDTKSWHLIRIDETKKVRGCARVLVHSRGVKFSEMRVAESGLAHNPIWASRLRKAVEQDLALAESLNWIVVEPGGWVVDEESRRGSDATTIALSAFAWSQLAGHCVAYVTATVKHGSASMLKRLGATPLTCEGEELPQYFDTSYGCGMQILRLQTGCLHSRFSANIEELKTTLTKAPVFRPFARPIKPGQIAA